MNARKATVVAMIVLLAYVPVMSGEAPLGKVIPRSGASMVNGIDLKLETTLFSGDTVATKADSIAMIQLTLGDQVHFGPATTATLRGSSDGLVVSLNKGMTLARSGNARNILVNARGLLVRPEGSATYEVAIEGNAVFVASRHGNVDVVGTNRAFTLAAGKSMKFELGESTQGPVGVGAHNFAPIVAVAIATAISLAIAVPISVVVANNAADDARRDACIAAIRSVSPTAPTTQCQ